MKRYIRAADTTPEGVILYRDGSVDYMSASNCGAFFTTDLEYLRDNQDLGDSVSPDRAKRYLLLSGAKVWDPSKDFDVWEPNSWAHIYCLTSDLEKFGVEVENYAEDWDGNIDTTHGWTSTDGLAYAGKQLGYDATLIQGIPRDGGWGKSFDEYAVYNPAVIKPF